MLTSRLLFQKHQRQQWRWLAPSKEHGRSQRILRKRNQSTKPSKIPVGRLRRRHEAKQSSLPIERRKSRLGRSAYRRDIKCIDKWEGTLGRGTGHNHSTSARSSIPLKSAKHRRMWKSGGSVVVAAPSFGGHYVAAPWGCGENSNIKTQGTSASATSMDEWRWLLLR